MAIYHFSGQIMSRISKQTGKPKSPLAAAAYRSGDKLVDEVNNQTYFYKRETQPVTHILTPYNAPEWAKDRERLWNEVNRVEKNYNAQFAREFNVALPVELTSVEQEKLTLDFCQEAFVNRGMVADIAIHRDDLNNPHFHVMLTVRPFNEDGSWGVKAKREYKFDENGEHILDKNGKKAFYKVDTTDWNTKDTFNEWRKLWAEKANFYLKENGIIERISHLSNEDQGIEYIPTIHEGFVARKMENRGLDSDRVAINTEIKDHNQKVAELHKFKEAKQHLVRQEKFIRKFSPQEKKQLAEIAKEIKFFVNFNSVQERREQLKEWKKSIKFTLKNETKMKQLARIEKEENLLNIADEIFTSESERFIKSYYPTWDADSLSLDEKILLVEETVGLKRILTEDEIDLIEERAITNKFNYEMNKIYANPYAFAMTLDYRVESVMSQKRELEKVMNITANSSEVDLRKASINHPKAFNALKKLVKHTDHIFQARDLITNLYNLQLKRMYPDVDISRLSFQEKDFLISGAEYYGKPISKESVQTLQRYSIEQQKAILNMLFKTGEISYHACKTELSTTFGLNSENPRQLLFFKDECLRNINQYTDPESYLKLLEKFNPAEFALEGIKYTDVQEMNEWINNEFANYSQQQLSGTQLIGVTNGMLQGLLEDRSYSSKKQFEDDLKSKAKKMKNNRRGGPSL